LQIYYGKNHLHEIYRFYTVYNRKMRTTRVVKWLKMGDLSKKGLSKHGEICVDLFYKM
jgi:hypothetical protein